MDGFSVAAGSTVGRDHRHAFRNNQDSYAVIDTEDTLIAVVTDGCGSGTKSEVGAQIGARLVARYIREECDPTRGAVCWNEVERLVLTDLYAIAAGMSNDHKEFVRTVLDGLLFTIVGVVISATTATFFAIGDGTIIVNGETTRFEFPNNQPPYLGYRLIPQTERTGEPEPAHHWPVRTVPLSDLRSFLIGTDGVDDLIRHESTPLPGTTIPVGPIDQFWLNDRYFRGNPELLSRQLRLIGRDWPLTTPNPGLLHDDTTVIVGRRTEESEEPCHQSN